MTEGAEMRIDELEAVIARTVNMARADQQRAADLVAKQSCDTAELTELMIKREAYIIELLAKQETFRGVLLLARVLVARWRVSCWLQRQT